MTETKRSGATTTQPRPNLSTEPNAATTAPPTVSQSAPNLSTEHQRTGDGRRPSDTLDRGQSDRCDADDQAEADRTSPTDR